MPAPSNCICCYIALYDCCKAKGKRFIDFLAWISLVTTLNSEKPSLCWCEGGPVGTDIFHQVGAKTLLSGTGGPRSLSDSLSPKLAMTLRRLWRDAEHWSCTAALGYSLAEQIMREWGAGLDFDNKINATRWILQWCWIYVTEIKNQVNQKANKWTHTCVHILQQNLSHPACFWLSSP